jgi:hypothetical protein
VSTPDVAIPIPATPGAASRPIDGPAWRAGAVPHDTRQADGRGVLWVVARVEQGGRVLHWVSWDMRRRATTTATPAMPGYPGDDSVVAATRQARRAE